MANETKLPSPDEVRAEIRAWLAANWKPTYGLVEWRNILVDGGWASPGWPSAWHGRDYTPPLVAIVDEEMRKAGAVGPARAGPRNLASATILEHGNDAQKARFLRRILIGEDSWCQLFSEPGNGSDLAGAITRADFKDGKWIINGQKVWTTSAHHADWGLLVARTDWDAPKHQGLSYFLLNMRQPGVEVRPLRQMNGHASFNEVFFTDAVAETEHLLGRPGEGWAAATTTLMHERRGFGGGGAGVGLASGPERKGGIYEEERIETAHAMEPYTWYPQRAGRVDLVLPRAKETGAINDPVARQEIAKLLILARTAEWTARRARTAQAQIAAYRQALDEYISEETGHEQWILNDITAAGGDAAAAVREGPNAATEMMVAYAYDYVGRINPMGFFGMVFVLEGVSTQLASVGAGAVRSSLGLPKEAFTYLVSHGALDVHHLAFLQGLLDGVENADDRAAITHMARRMFGLFGDVFRSIPHVAAGELAHAV